MFSFLTPYMDAIKAGLVVGLLVLLAVFFIRHDAAEQAKGAAAIERADAAGAARQAKLDQERIDAATQSLAALQAQLDAALTAPPIHDPARVIRVCDDPVSPGPVQPSQDAGPRSGSDDTIRPPPSLEGPSESEGVEVTDETEAVLTLAGARIAYLQGYIRTCQQKGFCDASPQGR